MCAPCETIVRTRVARVNACGKACDARLRARHPARRMPRAARRRAHRSGSIRPPMFLKRFVLFSHERFGFKGLATAPVVLDPNVGDPTRPAFSMMSVHVRQRTAGNAEVDRAPRDLRFAALAQRRGVARQPIHGGSSANELSARAGWVQRLHVVVRVLLGNGQGGGVECCGSSAVPSDPDLRDIRRPLRSAVRRQAAQRISSNPDVQEAVHCPRLASGAQGLPRFGHSIQRRAA